MFTKKQFVTAKLIEKNWLILQFFFITMTSFHLSKTQINRKLDFRVLGTYDFSSRKKITEGLKYNKCVHDHIDILEEAW